MTKHLTIAILVLATVLTLANTAQAETPAVEINVAGEADNLTTLTVEGTASRSVSYDGAIAWFSITALDQSVITAVSQGNSALADVSTALQMGCNDDDPNALCVPTDQLQDVAIRINEEFDWIDGQRVSRGYRYTRELSARIDDIEQAGLLIDAILKAGGDHVRFGDLNYTASGQAAAEGQALLDAIDDAQATANAIATHMGYEIVRIVELSPLSLSGWAPYPEIEARALAADEAAYEPTQVFAGTQSVTQQVRIVFELRPLPAQP